MKDDLTKMIRMAELARRNHGELQSKMQRSAATAGLVPQYNVPSFAGRTPVFYHLPQADDKAVYPVYVNMHGGGFILGSAADDKIWCSKIADSVGCIVVNIDYHLAPEHKFPIALEETYDVIKWLRQNAAKLRVDPDRIAIGGQSAGANLAAGVCLLAQERQDFALLLQVLNCPPLDFFTNPFSKRKIAENDFLSPKDEAFFHACYMRGAGDLRNPFLSPVLAKEHHGLPEALIIAAEYDPLSDEAQLYAEQLAAAGVKVNYKVYPRCKHVFTHTGGPKEAAREALLQVQTALRGAFAK